MRMLDQKMSDVLCTICVFPEASSLLRQFHWKVQIPSDTAQGNNTVGMFLVKPHFHPLPLTYLYRDLYLIAVVVIWFGGNDGKRLYFHTGIGTETALYLAHLEVALAPSVPYASTGTLRTAGSPDRMVQFYAGKAESV